MLLFCSLVPTEVSLRRWGLAKAFSPSFSFSYIFFVPVAVKMVCVVLTCSITALLGNAVLSFSLSFNGLCGCVWPSACNLITELMLGAGASSAPPPRATCAAKTWACRVFSGAGEACSCLSQLPGVCDQGFYLGSLLLCPSAVTLQLLDSVWPQDGV